MRRIAAIAIGYVLAGAFIGYASLAAGPVAATLAVVMVIVLVIRFRHQPERPGAFLLGIGLAGAATLLHVIATCVAPGCSYAPSTWPGVFVFLLLAAMGGWLLLRAAGMARRAGARNPFS
ncbi:MAG TPA: hypothetical protein VET65_14455 [Candidatus Limnocylindrales bacterium]|nr:hypothetical protein [Candidatus Limnocylindrales bacterium]